MEAIMPFSISGSQLGEPLQIGLANKILVQQDGNRKGSTTILNLDQPVLPDNWPSWPDHNDVFKDEGIVPTFIGHGRCSSGSDISQMEEMYPDYTILKSNPINTISVSNGTSTCLSPVFHLLEAEETFQNLQPLVEGTTGDTFSSLDTTDSIFSECFSSCESSTSLQSEEAEKISILQSTFKRGQNVTTDVNILAKKTKFSVEQSVDDKNDKYLEQRRKNNIASRCSRLTRKQRQKEMEAKAAHLEQDNETLRVKINQLEELAQLLKTELVNAVLKNKQAS